MLYSTKMLLPIVASEAGTHCTDGFFQQLECMYLVSCSQLEVLVLVVVAMSIGTQLNSISIAFTIKAIPTSPATNASKLENVENDIVPLSGFNPFLEELFFRRPGKNHLNLKRIIVFVQYSLDLALNVFEVQEVATRWQLGAQAGVEVIV